VKLFLDMDGVLCDFIGEVERRTGRQWEGDGIDLKAGIGMSLNEVIDTWPTIFAELSMTPFAQQLLDAAAAWDTYIITDCCSDCRIAHGKVTWITDRARQYIDRLFFCRKKRELIGYDDCILIDDMDHHNPDFLVPQPWNRNRKRDQSDWTKAMIERLNAFAGYSR